MSEEGFREKEVLAARRDSLERLRERGVDPFALRFEVTARAADLHVEFESLPAGQTAGEVRAVAGRVVLDRRHGKLVFLVVRDATGDLQLFCAEDHLGPEGFALLEEIDLGDIVGARGPMMRTRRGELSVRVDQLTLLTKSLRPLPEKWHGLKDPDLQQRRRYLHLVADPGYRRVVHVRAGVLKAFRRHLDERGFVEVETPVLQPQPGGGLARPFVTRFEALELQVYLRIALELHLKRLLVGGLERVYEIGRNFRNEGIDRTHFPEFTMLEAYRAYADYEDMMELVEGLVRDAAMEIHGSHRVAYQGQEIDVGRPWARITLLGAASEAVGEEVTLDRTDLADVAERHGVRVDPAWGPGKIACEMFEKLVAPSLVQPTFVKDFPEEISPLARPHRERAGLTEHFDPYLVGMELGAAYSELTDPDDQRARFEQQQRARAAGDEEAHPLDEDFLRALEHGMPPTGGLGLGVDRLVMVLADMPSIRDVILFPSLRPEG